MECRSAVRLRCAGLLSQMRPEVFPVLSVARSPCRLPRLFPLLAVDHERPEPAPSVAPKAPITDRSPSLLGHAHNRASYWPALPRLIRGRPAIATAQGRPARAKTLAARSRPRAGPPFCDVFPACARPGPLSPAMTATSRAKRRVVRSLAGSGQTACCMAATCNYLKYILYLIDASGPCQDCVGRPVTALRPGRPAYRNCDPPAAR